jgi:hypothetical protein
MGIGGIVHVLPLAGHAFKLGAVETLKTLNDFVTELAAA